MGVVIRFNPGRNVHPIAAEQMVGFVSIAVGEMRNGEPVLEQFTDHYSALIAHTVLFTVATIVPAAVSSNSLASLMATATKSGLPEELRALNKDVEMLHGRLAMLGIVGLAGVEFLRGGSALFAWSNLLGLWQSAASLVGASS